MRACLVLVLVGGVASAGPPHGAKHIAIDYTYLSFHRDARHYKIEWTPRGYVSGKRTIDRKAIDAIYAALTDLHDSNIDQRCISHTDDYPELRVTIDGDEPLVVASNSNCHDNVPWNITRESRMFAQYNGKAGRAVEALLVAVDPDHWKTPPDSPEATFGLGVEHVTFSHYHVGEIDTFAGSCAHELETDPRARELFGDAVHVDELELVCDLVASPECTQTIAATTLRWASVSIALELGCTGGHVDFPTSTPAIAALRPVIESKPVRALVKLSKQQPRMFFVGTWQILSDDVVLPRLDYDPSTKLIATHVAGASGAAFMKALGLDTAKLTTTDLTLDLDGRVTSPDRPSP
jgi:hypothetical protein